MGTLYECLREARLEQFYPAFRANGITRSESLIDLGMPEFCALGITDNEDRRRLKELVNIIKEVHTSGFSASPTPQRRSGGSRQLQPNTSGLADSPQGQDDARGPAHSRHRSRPSSRAQQSQFEAASAADPRDRVPNFSAASYLDMLQLVTDSSDSEADAAAYSSDEETVQPQAQLLHRNVSSSNAVRSSVNRSVSGVERVKPKVYNYGVHKVNTPTKNKPPRSSANRAVRDEKIKVCVRKRPLTRREFRAKDEDVVNVESTTTLIVNEPKLAVDLKAYTLQHEFIFDEVFHESCSNEDVYTRAARPLISCIFNGGSATCFAYGQTGAGKTHTMLGDAETPGLYLLAGRDIFNIIDSGQYGHGLHVWISFFEIYCGQLFDLLNRRNRLHAREDGSRQVCIAGLTETEATSVNSLVQTLEYGNSVRSKGATGVNPDSSRSHAILQLDIRNSEDLKVGKISFIDLAGSERASDVTDTDKQTRMEGAEINQSLLALKECIRSIDQDSKHTPFRQSKLTHILKDSFVGNSRTCMIANISPSQGACENTLNTLRYADRVKELKRDSLRSSTVGQAMNLLMNIPPTAPSIFHPSNILSTSTPMRPQTQSRIRDRPTAAPDTSDVTLDLSDTPIRGHNLPRRPHVRESSSRLHPAPHQGSTSADNRPGDAVSPPPPPLAVASTKPSARSHALAASAASQGATAPPPDASPSESDHTDTDSNNVTHQNFKLGATAGFPDRKLGVAGSMDTEFDFPTSDFNNPDEFNDLNHPQPQGDAPARPAGREGRHLPDPGPVAASGAETADPAIPPTANPQRPVLKPVVYRSVDREADVDTSANFSSVRHNFQPPTVTFPKVSEHPPNFKKAPLLKEFFSSDESLDDEELLASGPPSGAAQALNNLAAPPSQQITPVASQQSSRADFINKRLMLPQPAVSSDLTKFTQRPSLRPSEYEQSTSTKNDVYLGGGAQSHASNTPQSAVESPQNPSSTNHTLLNVGARVRDRSPTARAKSPGLKSPRHREMKQALDHDISPDNKHSPEEWRSHRRQHSRQSPVSLDHAPHPPPSPPPGRQPSPTVGDNRGPAKPLSDDPLKSGTACAVDDTSSGAQRHSDISSPKGGHHYRRAASSPTGEKSDDSSEGIRASLSDQGQGGYRRQREIERANMRKERSDPMLALDLQRKKQTLPDPQSFSKMLTRSNTPKSALSHHRDTSGGGGGSSWKVVHDQLPSPKSGSERHHATSSNQNLPASNFAEHSPGNSGGHNRESHSEPSSLAHGGNHGTGEGGGHSLQDTVSGSHHHQGEYLAHQNVSEGSSIGQGRAKPSGRTRDGRDRTPPSGNAGLHQGHPSQSNQDVTSRLPLHSRTDSTAQLLPNKMSQQTAPSHALVSNPRMETDITHVSVSSGTAYQQSDNINSNTYFKGAASAASDLPGRNAALVTEKLAPGAVFSPIHPYPTTVAGTSKAVGEPATASSQLFQPTPATITDTNRAMGEPSTGVAVLGTKREHFTAAMPGSNKAATELKTTSSLLFQPTPVPVDPGPGLATAHTVLDESVEAVQRARSELISAHEDQLASITSLCKHEMRLLLNAKKVPGKRGFDEYLRRVSDILQQKMAAIASLQGQITLHRSSYPASSVSRSVTSSVSASVSDSGGTTAAQHPPNRLY